MVWGLGDTAEEAIAAARTQSATWDSHGSATLEVDSDIAYLIESGEIDCQTLGIVVRLDRDLHIIDAGLSS